MKIRRALLLLLLAALAACAAPPPAPDAPAPHGLAEPFLGAWRAAGGEAVGPPVTPPLWVDDYQVQLFARHRITAVDGRRAVAEPLPAGWQAGYPAELLALPASPWRASLAVDAAQDAVAAPLAPLAVELRVPGYTGRAELRLYDAALRPAGAAAVEVADGAGRAVVLPRGRLGPQWAVALVEGQAAGAASALFTLDAATELHTGDPALDALYPRLRGFMERAAVSYELDGRPVRGYRSPDNPLLWLRDHVYQGRGFRYFEPDVTSLLDAFRRAQRPDGSFPDVVDYPALFVTAFRKETESDLEFLFIQGVYEAWQMSGDDAWLRENLEAMRRAATFITSDPLRWDAERGLVRRPYTIDMWDFAYGPTTTSPDGKPAPRHWIEPDTVWGTFHGDNTGLAHALELLARAEERVGDPARAQGWRDQGRAIMARLNALSWNGRFFTHFVPEDPAFSPAGVDPAAQLSLSNAYALNRGVLDQRQGQGIVETYFGRRDFGRAFAEWYGIDPPFPPGSYGMAGGKGENPGEYVNGGIMPLVGGELARGAFRFGMAPYGFDILRRYAAFTELTGASYLWYYPDGRPGIQSADTIPTDGWGAGAMIGALMEGAAGFDDGASRFEDLFLSPRWAADPALGEVRAVARYAASDAYAAYLWHREEGRITLTLTGTARSAYVRVLVPQAIARLPLRVTRDGEEVPAQLDLAGETPYVAVPVAGGDATITVEW
ncbi:MAG TPA: hypothetical protein PKD53_12775 [Chloroflexaceae bacterium]|nr:hypothetical protein [Chloroflexaceae bacterium]